MKFSISRFDPTKDKQPYMQDYELEDSLIHQGMMLLEALELLQEKEPTLGFRHSCGEGVCGSDAMNINGKNGLSCITKLSELKTPITIRPLNGFPIIRDLIVDMEIFYEQLKAVNPFLQPDTDTTVNAGELAGVIVETKQTSKERDALDGHYECILCGCCSASCPSYWWNPDKFHGPAALLAANRFVVDTRDTKQASRLDNLKDDPYKIFRCRNIKNCTDACPKSLNPSKAINNLKSLMK